MTTPNFTWTCAHCGQKCGDQEGGYGAVTDAAGAIRAACSPAVAERSDCYRRVREFGEPLGALQDVDPKPAGVEDIRQVVTQPPAPVPGPRPTADF
jgi:hypothetical protein